MNQQKLQALLKAGARLSGEQELGSLLQTILSCVMDLAGCDAGTLYLREGDALRFCILRNNTLNTYEGGDGRAPSLPPVPLKKENVCALAFLENRTICIEDVYNSEVCDFSGPIRYDALTGYRTRSMLVVPMHGRGEVLGVLQLINALDEEGEVCAFSPGMAAVLESVASQAALAIQNVRYLAEIQELFRSFVRVMSTAIDARSPYNANHSRRMAENAGRFAAYLNAEAQQNGNEPPFSPAHIEELVMSVWLHDVGKVTTPLEVMDKAERLLPAQRAAIAQRMQAIRLAGRIARLEGRITGEEEQQLAADTRAAEERIAAISRCGFVQDPELEWLGELCGRRWQDETGAEHPWLTAEEAAMLRIRKGTLSNDEREAMQQHVVMTDRLLSQIHFSAGLSHVRQWAAAHHELLNGKGYPRQLTAGEIPPEVRILTILDIFDALVADDRPYKPGMPVQKALGILKAMAEQEGALDPALTEAFVRSRCWQQDAAPGGADPTSAV